MDQGKRVDEVTAVYRAAKVVSHENVNVVSGFRYVVNGFMDRKDSFR